ncbi:transcriptional repressor [Collinsella sp. zg1085]|uniref:Fur family transcriptional regulator n=1 Tax=Collinsella sp. zg1085 TaxID=2844380 RepID=UPI001C0B8A47|nr:transcriptional repressor [Collinsella sp. zg1085]QWT17239.1 transcriptional repressor [Collinsella sp. zg1085]
MSRGTYDTKQRKAILAVLDDHADSYMSVDEVMTLLHNHHIDVGRTTVYRTLERLVADGTMVKVADVRGGAAQYCNAVAQPGDAHQGQLRCEACGRVLPLSCSMLESFAGHILDEHGFAVDRRHTVITGTCKSCRDER